VTLKVRVAEPDDYPETARVHATSWQMSYRGLVRDEYLDNINPAAWAKRYETRRADGSIFLLAERDQRVVGMVRFGSDRRDPRRNEIYALYVAPEQQRTGVGSALLKSALDYLSSAPVQLWCAESNLTARTFYERHGFVADGSVDDYHVAGGVVRIVRYVLAEPMHRNEPGNGDVATGRS
jgi:GNAT superfamily N-acetyltransferase